MNKTIMYSIDVARIIGKTIARITCMPILMVSLTVSAATSAPLRYQSFSNLKSQTQTLVVKDIVQDNSGMMWFVDNRALSAWDGYNLHRYTHNEFPDMGSTRCALATDSCILVGYQHGLLKFDLSTRHFQRDSLYDGTDVLCLTRVGRDVWAGTDRGVLRNGRYMRLQGVELVSELLAVGDTTLYIGQLNALACYSIPTGRMRTLHSSSSVISALLWLPADSTVWVGTDNGLGTLSQLQAGQLEFGLPVAS